MQQELPNELPVPEVRNRLILVLDRWKRLQFAAAGLALSAGFAHALAGEEHFTIWWGYGLFFSIVSISQIMGGGALLFWCTRNLCLTGIAGTSVVLLLYVVTRTIGVPFGPEAGQVEGLGVLDAVSKVLECSYVICLLALLRRPVNATSAVAEPAA